MREGGRAWGLAAQVYAFRSAANLGIGTYADVREAARGAAPLGASFIGLSPVHALFASDRTKVSPYSPSSRLFLETLHIDPQAVPGFAGSEAARLLAESGRQARIAALRDAPLVDHAALGFELLYRSRGVGLECLLAGEVGGKGRIQPIEFGKPSSDRVAASARRGKLVSKRVTLLAKF